MPDYLPTKELDLQTWLTNFATVADSNKTQLGLTAADVLQVQDALAEFNNGLGLYSTQKAQLEGTLRDKNAARRSAEDEVRSVVRIIQARPGVSDGLKATLGITVPSGGRTNPPPTMPASLVAKPTVDGVNVVAWHRMGNKPGTQYVVYAKPLTNGARAFDETGWTFVGQTTRARFDHAGVIVGQPMAYRVMAARADQASLPSLPATVYGG